jgi:hypothetical protein
MALDTYGHVFDELDGAERISAEQAIRKARAEARATLVRPAPDRVARQKNETPPVRGFRKSALADSNCPRPASDRPRSNARRATALATEATACVPPTGDDCTNLVAWVDVATVSGGPSRWRAVETVESLFPAPFALCGP